MTTDEIPTVDQGEDLPDHIKAITQADVPAPAPVAAPVNPLLERAKMPGESHRLPSCGIFYNDGELDESVENGEVHIHPMTALDEITITSPSKIFSGDAIVEVIQRCVPSVRNAKRLLVQDVDFILLCLRKVSYGPTFDFNKAHEGCTADREEDTPIRTQTFQANMTNIVGATKEVDPNTINTVYRTELSSGQLIKFEPMRFDSYIKFVHANARQDDDTSIEPEKQKDMILGNLTNIILSVDEISDKKMIREWLEIITPLQLRDLHSNVQKMTEWGVDTSIKVKCRDCGDEMELDMPTNPLVLFS